MSKDAPSLREIRIFVAVHEERSFTAAAQREHATQSGVSHHIRNMEQRLGTPLFLRQRGGVIPTPAGTEYYARCLEVLRWQALTLRGLGHFAIGLSGRLAAGLMPAMTYRTLARACQQFQQVNPNVTIKIIDAYSAKLVEHVLAGELDFAIVPQALGLPPGLARRPFVRSPEHLVSARFSGLTHRRPVRLKDLKSLNLVVPTGANPFRAVIDDYLGRLPIQVQLLEMDSMLGLIDLVRRSEWMAILPGMMLADEAADAGQRELTVNPLADPELWFDLQVVQQAAQPLEPAGEAFLEALRQATHEPQVDAPHRSA